MLLGGSQYSGLGPQLQCLPATMTAVGNEKLEDPRSRLDRTDCDVVGDERLIPTLRGVTTEDGFLPARRPRSINASQ